MKMCKHLIIRNGYFFEVVALTKMNFFELASGFRILHMPDEPLFLYGQHVKTINGTLARPGPMLLMAMSIGL